MAGAFGLERDTMSRPRTEGACCSVRSAPGDALVLTDGFSCCEELEQATRRSPQLAQALAARLEDAA